MNMEKVFNLFGSIVGVATVAVILQSPNTARVIQASFNGLSQSLNAAMRT